MSFGVEAHGLRYRVGSRALVDGVDLAIERGEVVAICGPNGAGKSTLLRLLAGELEPCEGEVALEGRSLRSLGARELAHIRAVLPQEASLRFAFTVEEIVAMGRAPYRRSTAEQDGEAIARALAATDTAHLAGRTWPTLSGGERARVMLARVLAQDTPVLLLDEPTSALDLRHQLLALQAAGELAARGRTVVAVLHDLNLAARFATRVALMKDGCIEVVAPPWEALTPARLEAVFETSVSVVANPLAPRPLVLPAFDVEETAVASVGTCAAQDQRTSQDVHEGGTE